MRLDVLPLARPLLELLDARALSLASALVELEPTELAAELGTTQGQVRSLLSRAARRDARAAAAGNAGTSPESRDAERHVTRAASARRRHGYARRQERGSAL